MGISFLGNTSDYKTWFFDIDGKTFVARNNSTQSPLKISFSDGRFFGTYTPNQIAPGSAIVKNTGFDIITSTSQTAGNSAGMVLNGIVEWTYGGLKYRSRWTLTEGRELDPAIPEEGVQASYDYTLDIVSPYVIYNGPTGGAVGTGVVSQPAIGGTTTGGGTTSGGGTTTPPPPTAVAGTDWVKLGLQLGAAYLLLS